MWKDFAKRWELVGPWVYGVLALGCSALFGAVAIAADIWPMGVFALVLLLAAVHRFWVGARILRAAHQGAKPVSHVIGERLEGRCFSAPASHSRGYESRDGVVVFVDGVAAFIPTSEWGNSVANLAASALVRKISMVEMPQNAEELYRLVESSGGHLLGAEWRWSLRGVSLVRPGQPDLIQVRISEPHRSLWRDLELDADRLATLKKVLFGSIALTLALVAVSVGIYFYTGDIEILQGCGCQAMLPVVVGVIVNIIVRKRTPSKGSPEESGPG